MATKHFSDTAIADVQHMLGKADASGAYQKALLDIVDYFKQHNIGYIAKSVR